MSDPAERVPEPAREDPVVEEVLARLEGVERLPVDDQLSEFVRAHEEMRDRLHIRRPPD